MLQAVLLAWVGLVDAAQARRLRIPFHSTPSPPRALQSLSPRGGSRCPSTRPLPSRDRTQATHAERRASIQPTAAADTLEEASKGARAVEERVDFLTRTEGTLRRALEPTAGGPHRWIDRWADDGTALAKANRTRWRSWRSPFDADPSLRRLHETGIGNHGDEARFLEFARKLIAGEPVTIEFVGGSVTAGGFQPKGWITLFM